MVKTTALTICVTLLTLTATLNAQEKKPPKKVPPTTVAPGAAAPRSIPGGINIATELKKQIALQQAEIKKLVAEHGKDSAEVRNAQQALKEMQRFAKQAKALSAPGNIDPADFAPPAIGGDRAAMMRDYFRSMLEAGSLGSDDGFGNTDPRRTAVQGLEFELKALAGEIRSTKDAALKRAKIGELREIAETVVVLKARYRNKAIKQLEEKLAALKAEDKEDSADALVARLLQTEKKAAGDNRKVNNKPKAEEKE